MRPTRRGWASVGIVGLSIAMAWLFGARALNAVAAPAVVGLLVGAGQLWLADDPRVERTPPEPGFPGERRAVSLAVEGGTTVVSVRDRTGDGVSNRAGASLLAPPATVEYELEYERRGAHEIGLAEVQLLDVFGLLSTTVAVGDADEAVVYPRLYTLQDDGTLAGLLTRARTPERQEFEDLREYVPGDPLRDVHWKSSAKRDDLIVKEFAGREPEGAITVAGSASAGDVDLMASTVASTAVAILDAGLAVEVAVPDNRIRAGKEYAGRNDLLSVLARTGDGKVDHGIWANADVTVMAAAGEATVTVGDRRTQFDVWQADEGGLAAAVAASRDDATREVTAR